MEEENSICQKNFVSRRFRRCAQSKFAPQLICGKPSGFAEVFPQISRIYADGLPKNLRLSAPSAGNISESIYLPENGFFNLVCIEVDKNPQLQSAQL